MDFTGKLVDNFNKISDIPIKRSEDQNPDSVITLFMNSSEQNHVLRIKYLAQAYEDGLEAVSAAMDSGIDDLYDEYLVPIIRAIEFSMNELLTEVNGDVELCQEYIKYTIKSVPDIFKGILSSRISYDKQDSLSRILEGQDMCAALTIVGQTVNIATNAIHIGKKGGVIPETYNTHLNNVMLYLVDDSKAEERKSIFLEICKQRLAPEAKNGLSLPDEILSCIVEELLNDHHSWRDRSVNQIMVLLERSFGTKLLAIRQKILSAYCILDRTAHDFKKIEKKFKDFKYEILVELAGKGRHAEMKLIDHLLENVLFKNDRGLPKTYISISKICCADCQHSIKALNAAIKQLHKLDDFISYASTSSRAGHDQKFHAWQKPRFLSEDINNYNKNPEVKKICEKVRNLYQPVAARRSRKSWQPMYATESESEKD